jgi:hypothetical protein
MNWDSVSFTELTPTCVDVSAVANLCGERSGGGGGATHDWAYDVLIIVNWRLISDALETRCPKMSKRRRESKGQKDNFHERVVLLMGERAAQPLRESSLPISSPD